MNHYYMLYAENRATRIFAELLCTSDYDERGSSFHIGAAAALLLLDIITKDEYLWLADFSMPHD